MQYPSVTFINNPEEIRHYSDILRYAHENDKSSHSDSSLPLDRFFYPQQMSHFENQLHGAYPGRYLTVPYHRLHEAHHKA